MSEETKKPAEEQTKKAEYISEKAMAEILKGIRQRLPVKEYANKKFSPEQMKQIRLGVKNGIDYEVYANGNFSAEQMQKIRLEMLIAKIIDYIKEKFTQLYQSMKAYANLYMTKLPVEPEEDMSPEDVKDAQLFTLMKRAYDKMNDNYEDFEEMSFDEKVDSIMKEFERVNENERTHTVAKSNELIPEGVNIRYRENEQEQSEPEEEEGFEPEI